MAHKNPLKALHRTLIYSKGKDQPFGGAVIINIHILIKLLYKKQNKNRGQTFFFFIKF